MHAFHQLLAAACFLWPMAIPPACATASPPCEKEEKPDADKEEWPDIMSKAMARMGTGGGYACTAKAFNNFINAFHDDEKKGIAIYPEKARPSFCSSAVYTVLLLALDMWDSGHERPVIPRKAWLALHPKKQADGVGPWGYANANGPGFAMLIHELKAGYSFTQWERAQPGDIMKLWWTEQIGGRERGHLAIYRSQTDTGVTFWSSNQNNPNGKPGYGIKTVPKSQVRHVLFTRITNPKAFINAPTIGANKWLGTLLKTDITPAEMHRRCGISPITQKTHP